MKCDRGMIQPPSPPEWNDMHEYADMRVVQCKKKYDRSVIRGSPLLVC
jgi:hypothetical protein